MAPAATSVTPLFVAMTFPARMLPEVVVVALIAPPVADTLVNVKSPLLALNVMFPLTVVAEATSNPPAVSATLIEPAPETEAVKPPVVALPFISTAPESPIPEAAVRLIASAWMSAAESADTSSISPADVNVAEFPNAVALATIMLPLVNVDAIKLPPVATTFVKVKAPLVADNVIAPFAVVADVTVSPAAVSATLMTPAPETAAVSVDALISNAALAVPIPEPAFIETVPPETSGVPSIAPARVTVVPADKVTLPLVVAT
jgi:hypothetical protein